MSRRRTRSSALLSSSARCAKRSTGAWLKRKKSLPALGKYNLFQLQFYEKKLCFSSKNHARAMDSMGASLEAEQRAKADALRVKKKLEGEIN